MLRASFIFYSSYYEAISELPEEEQEKYQFGKNIILELQEFIKNHTIAQTITKIFYDFGYYFETIWNNNVSIYSDTKKIVILSKNSSSIFVAGYSFSGSKLFEFSTPASSKTEGIYLSNGIVALCDKDWTAKGYLPYQDTSKIVQNLMKPQTRKYPQFYTEKDFLVPYNAADALGDEKYINDEIMVQGIMDCVLENGNEITIDADDVKEGDTLKDPEVAEEK